MNLFNDCVGFACLSLNENKDGRTIFRGKFQEADVINKNRRMYPESVLRKTAKMLEEQIQNRGMFGELDHPTDSIVHLANASHIVSKLWWEGKVLMGEGEVLNTPAGKVLKALIEGGVRIGISSRGVGSGQVNSEGVLVIGESYKLITFDAVADPSTPFAYQEKYEKAKKETYEATPEEIKTIIQESNKVNPKALISYFGEILNTKMAEFKNKI